MKKHLTKIVSVLLIMCFCLTYLPTAIGAKTTDEDIEKVEVWNRTDIILKSEKEYDNPYKDVEIDALFTHEDGVTTINLYGFWNGGDEWRVRFAPTKTGVWTYEVTCSDTANSGLHGVSGSLLAVENTGTTELDRRGFVKISDSGRYFVYDDGTPFYWLGDTNWQAPNYVSISQCNYPGCSCGSQFMHEVNDRLAKGFTVYQTYFDSGESDGGGQRATTTEPSMWIGSGYNSINPETFTEKFDVMFDYLAARGMVIALGLGVHSNTTNAMGKENLDRISRYLTARYASYPVVWITAQEITGAPQYDLWVSSAEIVDAGDGYNHPQGAHQFVVDVNNSYVKDLDQNRSWHEFYALQGGHGPTYTSKSHYEGYWNNTRSGKVKPYIETEANYEDIFCGGFNGYDASRIAAWKANLLGSYGFTYGATGVWANNYSTAGNTGWLGSFSYEPWYMGIDKPGSFEMSYLASFFRYVDFSTLIPRFNDTAYSNLTEETKVVSSSEDGKTYVAYFYNATRSTGELRGLNDGETYSAKWYNPLTGKFVEISDSVSVTGGVYVIPEKPTSGDWALLVTSRTDLGEYGTESAYTDDLIDNRANYALEATAAASSNNGDQYQASKAIDGDLSTYWCASGGNLPQWFLLDMKEARTFAEINLIMHPGNNTVTEYATITVEGSNDGTSFTQIDRIYRQEPVKYKSKDLFRISQSGTYRYLKVTFEEIQENWATLFEISVYDAPSAEVEEETVTNILSGAIASASSDTGYYNDAPKANDGNSSTYWCANGGGGGHWLSFNMGEVRSFNRFSFSMVGSNTTNVNYVIEGSLDGSTWTEFYGELVAAPETAGNSVIISGSTETLCSCQYLRVRFLGLDGNWATVYEIEAYAVPAAQPAVDPVNIMTGAIGSASSDTGAANGASKAVDGSGSTWWCASSGNMPQWVQYDLGEVRSFNNFSFTMYGGTSVVSYVIEGSDNGTDWTTFYEGVDVATGTLGNSALVTGTTEDVCSCRYLRITFSRVDGNWATIVELEAYLISDGDTAPSFGGKIQTPGVYSTGSYIYTASGEGSDSAQNLFDGDLSTVWAPYGPIGTQTILMDLYEVKELYGINILLGNNAIIPDYRIEGSLDGENWTIIVDATLRDAQIVNLQDCKAVTEALSGNYRYVKLLWLNAQSNSAVKTIAEIELYAEGATPAAPASPDASSLIALYNEASAIRNSDKTYTGASYRALVIATGGAAEVIEKLASLTSASEEQISAAGTALRNALEGLIKTAKVTEPTFRSASILLTGQIGVNFFIELPEETDYSEAYVEFTVGDHDEVYRDEFDPDDTRIVDNALCYKFTCFISSIDMAETINATFVCGEQTTQCSYSVKQYISDFESLSSEYSEETVALVHALADYGHYGQKFLSESRGWTIGEDHAEMDTRYTDAFDLDSVRSAISGYVFTKDLGTSEVQDVTYSLNLSSEISVNIYITPESGCEVNACAEFNGKEYTAEKQGSGRYLIKITDIPVDKLGDTITVTGDADGAFSVSLSALSYARGVLSDDGFGENAYSAMAALYGYYAAAVAYAAANP